MINHYSRYKKHSTWLCVFIFALWLTGCSGVFFHPTSKHIQTPKIANILYSDVFLTTKDNETLHGWWLESSTPAKGTIYFLHGNAQNISHHLSNVAWFTQHGYQVFLIDYRGYGQSSGVPEISGVIHDIKTGFNWLIEQPKTQGLPIVVLGQSLGASLATYAIATSNLMQQHIQLIMLDSPFSSYQLIAESVAKKSWLTWWLHKPVGWAMPTQYDPIKHIDSINGIPLLLMHSTDDKVIPFKHGYALYEAANPPKHFLEYGGDHIAVFTNSENRKTILAYLSNTLKYH